MSNIQSTQQSIFDYSGLVTVAEKVLGIKVNWNPDAVNVQGKVHGTLEAAFTVKTLDGVDGKSFRVTHEHVPFTHRADALATLLSDLVANLGHDALRLRIVLEEMGLTDELPTESDGCTDESGDDSSNN